MRVTVETEFDAAADVIIQTVLMDNIAGDALNEMSRHIFHMQDAGVREALVSMGWTPPPEPPVPA